MFHSFFGIPFNGTSLPEALEEILRHLLSTERITKIIEKKINLSTTSFFNEGKQQEKNCLSIRFYNLVWLTSSSIPSAGKSSPQEQRQKYFSPPTDLYFINRYSCFYFVFFFFTFRKLFNDLYNRRSPNTGKILFSIFLTNTLQVIYHRSRILNVVRISTEYMVTSAIDVVMLISHTTKHTNSTFV